MDKPNYILEINKFYDWLETNPLSKSAISLWTALMHINNKSDWKNKFTVATSVLEYKTGFKKSELFKARNELSQKNRIIWNPRGGNLSAEYEITFFCFRDMDTSSNTNSNTSSNTNSNTNGSQMVTINKLNKTKQNKTKNSKSHSENEFSVIEKIENLKVEKPPEENSFFKIFTKIWFDFYSEKIGTKPIFNSVDGSKLKSIEKKLKIKAQEFQNEWTSELATNSFKQFLEISFKDKWRSENFSLSVIDSQFNQITAKALKNDNSNNKIEEFFANWK